MHSRTIPYRPDVDGLRAVAVLAVLVFHMNPAWLRGGFVGVDVFFVISGFLITAITRRELETGAFSLRLFYGRRVRRLVPALLVVLPATLVGGALVMSGPELARLGKHLLSATIYASNFTLWSESGYFDVASETKPLLHLWSLAVEEHFYFLWPLVMAWIVRSGRDLRRWTWGLALLSLVAGLVTIAFYRSAAFYVSPLRFWEILAGGALALRPAGPVNPRAGRVMSWCGASALGLALVTFGAGRVYPGTRALLPVLGTVLLLLAGGTAGLARRVLSHPALVELGRISYPLYLWHWPVLVMLSLLAPEARHQPAWAIGAAALALGLAELTYRRVERPAARALDPRMTAWRLLAPWAVIGAGGAWIWIGGGWPSRWPEFDRQMAALDDTLKHRDESCPTVLGKDELLHFCRVGGRGPVDRALVGDSHAGYLLPGLVANDPGHGWLLAGRGSCPPVLDLDFESTMPNCRESSRRILEYLVDHDEIKTVVLSAFGEYASLAADHKVDAKGPEYTRIGTAGRDENARYREMEAGFERMIDALEKAGKRVGLTIDSPELPFYPRACVARPFGLQTPHPCVLARAAVDARQARMVAMTERLRQRHPGLRVLDLRRPLCDDAFCYARKNGDLLYYDSHHLNAAGASLVAKFLLESLDRD